MKLAIIFLALLHSLVQHSGPPDACEKHYTPILIEQDMTRVIRDVRMDLIVPSQANKTPNSLTNRVEWLVKADGLVIHPDSSATWNNEDLPAKNHIVMERLFAALPTNGSFTDPRKRIIETVLNRVGRKQF